MTQNISIHPSACIDPKATIGKDVTIGPYCIVGPHVVIKDKVRLMSHVCIEGHTTLGPETVVYPFAALGLPPQDLKYQGEPSTLEIGAQNQIREYVTIQPGTKGGGMRTSVGNGCLFMAHAHVAHDCHVGNGVIMANAATLAGHVVVEDMAFIGGLSAIHQFVRIGKGAIIGGMSGVEHDVIPYGNVKGERAFLSGMNIVGLKRRGATKEDVKALYDIYRFLFSNQQTLAERVSALLQRYQGHQMAQDLLTFVASESSRSLLMPTDEERENF